MDWEYKLITLFIAIIVVNSVGAQCAHKNPCECIRDDGMGFNLTVLAALGPLKSDNGSVVFQPCRNANLTISGSAPQPDTSNDCQKTSLCILDKDNHSTSLGHVEETDWIWPVKQSPELQITHKNKISRIELICANPGDRPMLTLLRSDPTSFKFQLSSDKLCLMDLRPRGLSNGSVLVIMFLVFSGTYFIGGSIILIICRGAVGKETIPNYEFWADLPALVRDGVTFTLTGCSVVSYERI